MLRTRSHRTRQPMVFIHDDRARTRRGTDWLTSRDLGRRWTPHAIGQSTFVWTSTNDQGTLDVGGRHTPLDGSLLNGRPRRPTTARTGYIRTALQHVSSLSLCSISYSYLDSWLTLNCDLALSFRPSACRTT